MIPKIEDHDGVVYGRSERLNTQDPRCFSRRAERKEKDLLFRLGYISSLAVFVPYQRGRLVDA